MGIESLRGMPLREGVLALLWMAGCAPLSRGPITGEPGPGYGQTFRCVPERPARDLPPPAALVDTASLTRALLELRESTKVDSGQVLLSLAFEPDGLNVRRDVLEHTVSPLVADSVQKLVFRNVAKAASTKEPWGARLRVGLGARMSYAVEPREYCPPRPGSAELERAAESFIVSGTRFQQGVRERTVLLRVHVDPAGYVADAKIVRGEGAGGSLERDLLAFVRRHLFRPARLDGEPAYGYVVLPVRVRG